MAKKRTDAAVEETVEPVTVPVMDGYPEALAAPGDEARVSAVLSGVSHLTDVASLATVARAVLSRCRACGVRPGVLAGICEGYRGE